MSFVDQASALERERRMQELLDRISTLSDDELKRLDRNLGVQVLIDDAVNSEFPINTVSRQTTENNIKALLSSRIETVRSNLTQILGFTPSDSDVQELVKLRRIYGTGFTGAMRQISQTINDVEGGISQVLKAIDTGITSLVDTATSIAQTALDQANQAANAAISAVTSTANAAISSVVSANTINSIRTSVSDITEFLNSPAALLPGLTNLFSENIDSKIRRIDSELDEISREIQEAARQRADSNVSAQNAAVIQNSIQQSLSTPTTNPDPVSEDGTPYYTYPNNA
jgi:phage-related protein